MQNLWKLKVEHKIRNYYKNIKKIQSHIKKIHNFYDNFKEINSNNDQNSLRELIENIEEFKKIDFDYNKNYQNFDAITSLTFGTFCTQSEDSSVKSSTLSSKNKLLNNNILKSANNNKNNNNNINRSNNNNINDKNKITQFNTYEPADDIIGNSKNNKKVNKNLKDNKNNKFKNSNDNTKENKKTEIKENSNKTNTKYNNNNFIEVKNNKLNNKPNKNLTNKEQNKNKLNAYVNKDNKKTENIINNKNQNQTEEKKQNNNKDLKDNKIEEEKEILEKKTQTNFSNLHILGSKINQLKYREPDESVEMTMPKESVNKNYNIVNTEYNFNDSSVCDEMISLNYETAYNMGRSTTNDYINKIGVKNNFVLSQELYKNKLFMRRNNNDFGKLKIEKSIESSTCCVSCT